MGAPPKTLAEQIAAATAGVTPGIEQAKLSGIPEVLFKVRDIPPPSQFYMGPDDFLVISGLATITTETLIITGRMMLVTGEIKQFRYTLPVPTAGVFASKAFPMAEGYLMNILATPTFTTTQRGQLYCVIQLNHGPSLASGITTSLLFQDYVDFVSFAGWPYGRMMSSVEGPGAISTKTLANPGAGTNFTFTVPASQRWRPRLLTVKLVTAVAAGTRDAAIQITDGTNTLFTLAPSATQAPSLTVTYSYGLNLGAEVSDAAQGFVAEPLPDMMLEPGSTIVSAVQNIQAADQLSAIAMLVEAWQSV